MNTKCTPRSAVKSKAASMRRSPLLKRASQKKSAEALSCLAYYGRNPGCSLRLVFDQQRALAHSGICGVSFSDNQSLPPCIGTPSYKPPASAPQRMRMRRAPFGRRTNCALQRMKPRASQMRMPPLLLNCGHPLCPIELAAVCDHYHSPLHPPGASRVGGCLLLPADGCSQESGRIVRSTFSRSRSSASCCGTRSSSS